MGSAEKGSAGHGWLWLSWTSLSWAGRTLAGTISARLDFVLLGVAEFCAIALA